MSKKVEDIYSQSLADAKLLLEAAKANVKADLEELMAPRLAQTIAEKLRMEILAEEEEEDVKETIELEDEESGEELEINTKEELIDLMKKYFQELNDEEASEEEHEEEHEEESEEEISDEEPGEEETEEEISIDELLTRISEEIESEIEESKEEESEEHLNEEEEEIEESTEEKEDLRNELEEIRAELYETRLLNKKLRYLSRLMKEFNLTSEQKVNATLVLEKAETEKEVVLVYETLKQNFKNLVESKSTSRRSRNAASNVRTAKVSSSQNSNNVNEQAFKEFMQRRAGILKD